MTALTETAVHRPVLLRDLPHYKRYAIKVWLLALGAVAGFLAVRAYAGAYFDITQAVPAVKNAFDSAFHADWLRHLLLRDEAEKNEAFIMVQVIGYYFARKWPAKPANRWDRFERWLGVANERLPNQGVHVLFLAPFWALVYALPGEGIFALGLWLTHHNAAEPIPWQVTVAGLFGSFFMGRRLARGFAYHLQRFVCLERLENGKVTPAWWMIWPLQRRFEWMASTALIAREEHSHPRLRRAVHVTAWALAILAVIFLTYQGWWVMKFFKPFPFTNPLQGVVHFSITDLVQGWL